MLKTERPRGPWARLDPSFRSRVGQYLGPRIQFLRGVHEEETEEPEDSQTATTQTQKTPQKVDDSGAEFDAPSQSLFPLERVIRSLQWKHPRRIGAGLNNVGNTCFMNATLQCLTYIPALGNIFCKRGHSSSHHSSGGIYCPYCALEKHISRALHTHNQAITPDIAYHLRSIGRQFRLGRQEDAHEFLRFLLDKISDICVDEAGKNLPPRVKETTFVHQVFGGYFRNQIRCVRCGYCSNTYDSFLDISVGVKGHKSVHKCLRSFTRDEKLQGENGYSCPRCKRKENAIKSFRIHRAPNVLALHLKRFEYASIFGRKISSFIEYPTTLDLSPYASTQVEEVEDGSESSMQYDLIGVLVHAGPSVHAGHYYAFVKNSNDVWYRMDDCFVAQVGISKVLRQNAYILFYSRRVSGAEKKQFMAREARKMMEDELTVLTPTREGEPPVNGRVSMRESSSSSSLSSEGEPESESDDDDGLMTPMRARPVVPFRRRGSFMLKQDALLHSENKTRLRGLLGESRSRTLMGGSPAFRETKSLFGLRTPQPRKIGFHDGEDMFSRIAMSVPSKKAKQRPSMTHTEDERDANLFPTQDTSPRSMSVSTPSTSPPRLSGGGKGSLFPMVPIIGVRDEIDDLALSSTAEKQKKKKMQFSTTAEMSSPSRGIGGKEGASPKKVADSGIKKRVIVKDFFEDDGGVDEGHRDRGVGAGVVGSKLGALGVESWDTGRKSSLDGFQFPVVRKRERNRVDEEYDRGRLKKQRKKQEFDPSRSARFDAVSAYRRSHSFW